MSVGNRTQAETASSRGYTLIDVLQPENLARAWKQVKANAGAAGIDGMEVLALILKYLNAGAISRRGGFEESLRGVPQGGPLSPLMANVLLDELDDQLEERGHKFVRYADDLGYRIAFACDRLLASHVILCGSPGLGSVSCGV